MDAHQLEAVYRRWRQGLCLAHYPAGVSKRLLQGIAGTSCVIPVLLLVEIEDGLLDFNSTEGLHICVSDKFNGRIMLLMTKLVTIRQI